MLYPTEGPCLCGSELRAGDCCFPDTAPVAADADWSGAANLSASLSHPLLGKVPLPTGIHIEVGLNVPGQLDSRIIGLGDMAMVCAKECFGSRETWARSPGEAVQRLQDALYSTRYHQRQFLFRVRKVTLQQALLFSSSGTSSIRINDRAMRAEFEAFLVSASATLEALFAVVWVLLDRNPEKRTSLKAFLRQLDVDEGIPAMVSGALRHRIARERRWLDQLSDFRNRTVHREGFTLLNGVGTRGPLLLDAEVAGVLAGSFTVTVWRDLTALVQGCIEDLCANFAS